jgi:hypothetical protein
MQLLEKLGDEMYTRINLKQMDEYLTPCSHRTNAGIYFCRLSVYNEAIQRIIIQLIEAAGKSGILISQRLSNPDGNQLKYYEEVLGREFAQSPDFFLASLKKWIPQVKESVRRDIANCYYDIFQEMARKGKNQSIQRNTYIKFMCWLYYKFRSVLQQIGNDNPPKILFEGEVNEYELKMFTILARSGCDILLLQYNGDDKYRILDPTSADSQLLTLAGSSFPSDYSLMALQKQTYAKAIEPKLATAQTEKKVISNTFLKDNLLADVVIAQSQRGSDPLLHYNVFAGIYGVWDRSTYYQDILKWKLKLEGSGRPLMLIEDGIQMPSNDEVNAIERKNFPTVQAQLNHMVTQLKCAKPNILAYGQAAFLASMSKYTAMPQQKLNNIMVIMVCWLNRYMNQLFSSPGAVPLVVYYGEIKNENHGLFFSILAQLPLDVLILNPEGSEGVSIDNKFFYLKKYPEQLQKQPFPKDAANLSFGTVAYQAEQELNDLMYQDTGLYRNRQFQEAISINLRITFEEIEILWEQEAKYRPNFETLATEVMVPVIFSKVSGVNGTKEEYWRYVSGFLTDDTFLVKGLPYLGIQPNRFQEKAVSYLKNGKLDIRKVKSEVNNPLGILKDSMQDYMLKKLQQLIDSKVIAGTGQNGMEYLIVATVLNLDMGLLRLIQNYDFTKQIPKVLILHTRDTSGSVEDAILLAYLNLIGFDILLLVPTGYSSVERYYTKELFAEHQIGSYQYDLRLPNLAAVKRRREGFASKLFRRGK